MADAFVAIEDERFYEHNGVDLQGIIRAGIVGITSGSFSEGASTITQQLIKNNVFPNFVNEETFYDSVERKLQEQYLALQIEKEMSKEEILEAYMNTINLGQGCLGVQTASLRYFNKDVSELTLSECAVIAAITQNPSGYDPVRHPEDNAKRRQRVLDNMLEQGYITQEEYDTAIADPVYDRILQTASSTTTDTPYSYFTDALIRQVVQDLCDEKGYTETQAQAYNLLYSGGLTIISTQDSWIQQICDEEVVNIADYLTVTEYGLEYALTIHRADGTSENYSQEMLSEYLETTQGKEYPLIFSTEDEAYQAIQHHAAAADIRSRHGSVYRTGKSNRRRTRGEDIKPFSQPCDGFSETARFLLQGPVDLCSRTERVWADTRQHDHGRAVYVQQRTAGKQLGFQIYRRNTAPLCDRAFHERLRGQDTDGGCDTGTRIPVPSGLRLHHSRGRNR